jgi:tetratricopeptide (TPR) repeat protein
VGQGAIDDAEREYLAALRARPTDPFAHNGLGSLLDERGRVAEAISHYQAALLAAPEMADAHNNLAVALTKQGRIDDAVHEFSRQFARTPRTRTSDTIWGSPSCSVVTRSGATESCGRDRTRSELWSGAPSVVRSLRQAVMP